MFARVSTYEIPQGKMEEARVNFERAVARIRETEGLQGAHLLLATESDRAITITFWESQGAMAASRVLASRLRSEAAASVGGDVLSVDEFVVVSEE